jgi:hypothetical protein
MAREKVIEDILAYAKTKKGGNGVKSLHFAYLWTSEKG